MSRFQIQSTPLAGLCTIVSKRMGDERGYLARLFCDEELLQVGWTADVAQINLTHTREKGTVRGLHYQQPPHAEIKLVRCLRGEVWDVAVDLRRDSPTFLKWYAQHLSAKNMNALLIPQGFAHGFQTLTNNVEMLYLHSAPYVVDSEGGLNVKDPRLQITWPLAIGILSERDRQHPFITDSFEGLNIT
ncbi:dTDP-4-dehydrorhamnose 3,5-epimerase [Orrella sp. 11846]|uniref:dTDP-4-dehydrorhamnose 3,5-epimerase n=1 Tax=Orrella sp. 11846 TaxID=3409913 RepID=UPI003B5B618B